MRLILVSLVAASKTDMSDMTEEFFEKGGPPNNRELALEVFPYAKTALHIDRILRVIYFLACLKWPHVIKYCIYLDSLTEMLNSLLPAEIHQAKDT